MRLCYSPYSLHRCPSVFDRNDAQRDVSPESPLTGARNSCFLTQFTCLKHICQMLADSRNSHIEKYCHCLLRAPNGLIGIYHLNTLLLRLSLKDQELSCTISYFSSFCHFSIISHCKYTNIFWKVIVISQKLLSL